MILCLIIHFHGWKTPVHFSIVHWYQPRSVFFIDLTLQLGLDSLQLQYSAQLQLRCQSKKSQTNFFSIRNAQKLTKSNWDVIIHHLFVIRIWHKWTEQDLFQKKVHILLIRNHKQFNCNFSRFVSLYPLKVKMKQTFNWIIMKF